MTATATQIALVRATLPRLTKRPEQSAMAFDLHLSRYAPALGYVLKRCSVAPVSLLSNAIAAIESSDGLRVQVSNVAYHLRSAGMSPRGYMAVHAALMDMVAEHLGGASEIEDAWAEVIGMILTTMLSDAYGPRSHAMPLAA